MDDTFGPGTDLPGGPGIPRRPGAPGSPCSEGGREKTMDFSESEHDHHIEKTFMQQFTFNSIKIPIEFLINYSMQRSM